MRSASLERAHRILRSAVAGVGAEQWSAPTPCVEWSVAQVVEHAALDQLLYVASLTGEEKPAADPFHPTGDLPPGVDTDDLARLLNYLGRRPDWAAGNH